MELREPTPVPSLHRRHVPRQRLTALLAASRAQALLVTAPAGYGKTSLACEWLAGRSDVAWYRATAASTDLAAFSVGIADAMAPLVPGAGERLRTHLRVAETPEQPVRPLAELLAEDIAGWPDGGLLVIDDYHLVAGSDPVSEFMDWLLTLTPLRVLVTSRRRPAWASARRVLLGEVDEITREQLAMTNDEAARVLGDRPGEAVRELVTLARGWPAVIGLAALAGADVPDGRVPDGLFRYFAEEVYRQQPAELQEFLLVASIPPAVGARSAREALGIEGAGSLIERLAGEGLLHETGRDAFQLHPLLRDFLRRKLEDTDPERAGELTLASIRDATERAEWETAFALAHGSDDLEAAAAIVELASPDLLRAGRTATLAEWLGACGAALAHHPGALLTRAELLIRQGRLREALGLARDVAGHVPAGDPRESRACWLAGRAAHFLSANEDALAFHLRARDTASDSQSRGEALWGAFLAAFDLERHDAADYLAELVELRDDGVWSRLRIGVGEAILCRTGPSARDVQRRLEQLLPLAEYTSDPLRTSHLFACLSYFASLNANYEDGYRYGTSAIEVCRNFRLDIHLTFADSTRIHAEIGLRRIQDARRALVRLQRAFAEINEPFLDATVRLLQLKLAIAEGANSSKWGGVPVLEPGPPRALHGELMAMHALVAASRGELSVACEAASQAVTLTRTIDAARLAELAQLIGQAQSGGEEDALRRKAVELAHRCANTGTLDTFVTAYRAYPRLLGLCSGDARARALVSAVALRAQDRALAESFGIDVPDATSGVAQLLTGREREVLELLARGLSNREISRQLFIELSTTKVHVHNILRKLGAETRLQAALLARGLLDADAAG
ncbi:MAG: hypothetical protein IT201_04620 [Thermoleophilia bacterium]|nr:hypothetical protein [Thermoleophilia bacterium]